MTSKIWIGSAIALAGLTYVIAYNNNAPSYPPQLASADDIATVDDIATADDPIALDIIAHIGPWPHASRLIGYRGRLWFAVSVKYRNHNSSDIWSMDPQTRERRLERNLFSQDAGTPVIFNDLLYWPHEDALLAGGTGEVSATNGEDWGLFTIQSALMYHTSELLDFDGKLLAVTGARHAGLQISADGGRSWKALYDHSAPPKHIARIKDMTRLTKDEKADEYYATLRDQKKQRLVKWNGAAFDAITSFPFNQPIRGLTAHKGAIHAIVGRGAERQIWQSNGETSSHLGRKGNFIDIASDGETLWAISNDGTLFSIKNDLWQKHSRLKGGKATAIEFIGGALYVAGAGDDGRAIIWGPKSHKFEKFPAPLPALPAPLITGDSKMDWEDMGKQIDRLLSAPETYRGYRDDDLNALLDKAANKNPPPGFFAQRLSANIPDIAINVFSGNSETKALHLAYANILRNMERSGQTGVPPSLLSIKWTAQSNSYEKYLALPLMALKTIAVTGQNDDATIAALIARLDYKDDPDWFKSQLVGTLTAVTGQYYGYDRKAWKVYQTTKL